MPDQQHLSAKDEALLILEYLESERMSETFLKFLDESKHLQQLRAQLSDNYEHSQSIQPSDESTRSTSNEFQTFFNFSKQMLAQQTEQSTKNSSDLFFDDDFLNDIISQTPPMDDFPETPIPSIVNPESDDLKSIEQLFATQHPSTTPELPSTTTTSFTKCIVVTQDFLQSFYSQSSTMTNNNNLNNIHRPKRRRRRRLKFGKENSCQQRKIMPRTS